MKNCNAPLVILDSQSPSINLSYNNLVHINITSISSSSPQQKTRVQGLRHDSPVLLAIPQTRVELELK